MIVLGIDPGYERLGAAILEKTSGGEHLLYSTCLQTAAKLTFPTRLAQLGREIEKLLAEWQPDCLAIEKVFFAKNQKTASQVSEVRGMLLYLAGRQNLPVIEYAPLEIKQTVAGYGQASKDQVAQMVKRLIKLKNIPKYDDEMDAIAVGLTALARQPWR